MRNPMSFWKGMVCADSLIMVWYVCITLQAPVVLIELGNSYLFYGVFFYSYAGQYTQANAFQGLQPYWGQTLCQYIASNELIEAQPLSRQVTF